MSIEHILLGLLRKPASGYALKALFDQTIRHFWAAELSQIYTTLQRMERKELLKSKNKPSPKGPNRRVYSLTAAGRKELHRWLESEPEFCDERHTYLAQIFFMDELVDSRKTVAFLQKVRKKRQDSVDNLRDIERNWLEEVGGTTDNLSDHHFHRYLTLRTGITTMSARVAWCDETIERVKQRMKTKPHRPEKTKRSKK